MRYLNQNQLISIDGNSEEKKKKAYEVFKSAFENLHIYSSIDDGINNALN